MVDLRRKTEALVEPDVLRWARETAGLSPEEAAHSLQVKDKRIQAWESGQKRPSMPQLRKMATVYKRLLSDFYLPSPPPENPLPHDFRRLPSEGVFSYSRPAQAWRRASLPKRNRSLVTPPVKFRILKIHAAETRPGKHTPRWEAPDFPRQRPAHCPLTLGNIGGSPTPGNHTAETALAGWGARIRTWEWRKSKSPNSVYSGRLAVGAA